MTWLWELDHSLFRAIHVDGHRTWLDPVFWVLSTMGLGHVQVPLILAFTLPWREMARRCVLPSGLKWLGAAFHGRRAEWKVAAGPLVLAFALSGILNTLVLKEMIERDRPSRLAWANPQEGFFYSAFPSGHTASSFGIAFMALILTWRTEWRWAGLATLGVAALIGFSRIYRGVHWPTDVLGGIAVGFVGAVLATLICDRWVRGWGLSEGRAGFAPEAANPHPTP